MSEHSQPLAAQPSLSEYAGTYARPPIGEFVITEEDSGLAVAAQSRPGSWGMEEGYGLVFCGRGVFSRARCVFRPSTPVHAG